MRSANSRNARIGHGRNASPSTLTFLTSEIAAGKKNSRPNQFGGMAILKKPFLCIGKTCVLPFLQCYCPGPGFSFRYGAAETAICNCAQMHFCSSAHMHVCNSAQMHFCNFAQMRACWEDVLGGRAGWRC